MMLKRIEQESLSPLVIVKLPLFYLATRTNAKARSKWKHGHNGHYGQNGLKGRT